MGAPEESRTQIGKLTQLARQRQPRRMYSDTLPGAFRRLSDHEQDATELYYSDSELIPGLLQTESYARALIRTARAASAGGEPGDVEARVQFRLDRQELLRRPDAPYMWFVIGEAALRRPIGHNEVLREQLGHLLDLIERHEQLVIQVAPLDIVDHPLLGCPIQILRFGGIAPDIVHQPTFIGAGVYLVDEEDIAECSRAFDRLKAVSLGPEESRVYIVKRLEGLENER